MGLSVLLWTLIRLVDVWVDEGNECAPAAHEQIVRVCNHGRVSLSRLLRLPLSPTLTSIPARSMCDGSGVAPGARAGTGASAVAQYEGSVMGCSSKLGSEGALDTGSILAPLIEKLMETGHVEEFVEQVYS